MKKSKVNAIRFCDWSKVNLGEWMTIGGLLTASVGTLIVLFNQDTFIATKCPESVATIQELHGACKDAVVK